MKLLIIILLLSCASSIKNIEYHEISYKTIAEPIKFMKYNRPDFDTIIVDDTIGELVRLKCIEYKK